MRTIFILILTGLFFMPELKGQEKKNGFEYRFLLIHPYRRSNEYKYSLDPSIEALYYISLSDKFLISGGIMAQTGNNKWEELTSHTIYDGFMWRPGRGYYTRELKYFCMGIPLRLEKRLTRFLFNSFYIGLTGGRYFIFDLTDSMGDKTYPEKIDYDKFFWDLQLGLTRNVYQSSGLLLGISPVAGVRIHKTERTSLNVYPWYGLSLGARLGK